LNTATGVGALGSNFGGGGNTANGYQALESNQSGSFNTASGWRALYSNVTGFWNTAYGYQALYNHSDGSFNTANGINALYNLGSGSNNIALGASAGLNLATESGNIYIGNNGTSREDNTIRVGTQGTQTTTFIAGIRGSPIAGTSVVVNNNGRLGTPASSQRFKDDIKPIDKASETIHALKPVTFRYKRDIDSAGTSQFGLVAEEVEKVNPDLVVRDADGEIYTVRYDAVNAMLLNEFLKEHRKVQELEATVIQHQKDFQFKLSEQEKQIEALAAGLQKVSAQLAAASPFLADLN
jgi:Chaperone of endosialidase